MKVEGHDGPGLNHRKPNEVVGKERGIQYFLKNAYSLAQASKRVKRVYFLLEND